MQKPPKPYPEFPLFAHATKRWAKKIRGKMEYFGPWDDPDGALQNYLSQKDRLHAGLKAKLSVADWTLTDACESYLQSKETRLKAKTLSKDAFKDCRKVCELLLDCFSGKRLISSFDAEDFKKLRSSFPDSWGCLRVRKFIRLTRSIFLHIRGLDDEFKIPNYGEHFCVPSELLIRREKQARGGHKLTRQDVLLTLAEAGPRMKAMILLGLNGGLGNNDVCQLPLSAVNLDEWTVEFPRPKTGVDRRFPLWPETTAAVKEYLATRKEGGRPQGDGPLFLDDKGRPLNWDGTTETVSREFRELMTAAGVNARKGISFYVLRHLAYTLMEKAKDLPARDLVMGHAPKGMAKFYSEWIEPERLSACVEQTRQWLWPISHERTSQGDGPQMFALGVLWAFSLISTARMQQGTRQ